MRASFQCLFARPRAALIATAALCAAIPLAATAPAQYAGGQWSTRFSLNGDDAGNRSGFALAAAGDVNQDGDPDIFVGAFATNVRGKAFAGSASLYSGANGGRLYEFEGQTAGDRFGWAVDAGGDVNGDSFPDMIVGAWGEEAGGKIDVGGVHVFSGLNGATLWHFTNIGLDGDTLGFAVADAGDLNNDGFDDVLMGAPGSDFPGVDTGAVYAYSGLDGKLIRRINGKRSGSRFGAALANLGDLDGDGFPDQAIGAPFEDHQGQQAVGAVYVTSGADGSVLGVYRGLGATDFLGFSVENAGDIDGDGRSDLIFGAYGADPGGRSNAGSAYLISTHTGLLLHQFDGEAAGDNLGVSVGAAGDVDGDGSNDVLVGARYADANGLFNSGSAYLFSGLDGTLIQRIDGQARDDSMGIDVEGVGDIDGDGRADIAAGADRADPGGKRDAGVVLVRGLEHPYMRFDAYELSATGGGTITAEINFPVSEVGYSYILLASANGVGPVNLGGLDIPLERDALFDDILAGNAPPAMSGVYGTLDFYGDAVATIRSHSSLSALVGRTYYLAAVSYHPFQQLGRLSSIPRPLTIVP